MHERIAAAKLTSRPTEPVGYRLIGIQELGISAIFLSGARS